MTLRAVDTIFSMSINFCHSLIAPICLIFSSNWLLKSCLHICLLLFFIFEFLPNPLQSTHNEPISLQMKQFIPFCFIYFKFLCSMPIQWCRVLSWYIFASGRVRMCDWRAQTGVPCGHSTHTGSTREGEREERKGARQAVINDVLPYLTDWCV